MAFTKIKFQDSKTWLNYKGELYRYWNDGDIYYANNRVSPIQTEISSTKGEWNGKITDVQHIKFTGWVLEFLVHETYLHSLSDIQSVDSIEVSDPDSNIDHTLVIDVIENLEVNFTPIDNGTAYVCTMTYRSDKVIINKADPILNKHSIRITDQLDADTDYYTDFDILPFVEAVEETPIVKDDGTRQIIRKTSRSGIQVLLYRNTTDLTSFETALNTAKSITVIENIATPTNYVTKYFQPIEKSQAGEDYNRVVIRFVTTETVIDTDTAPNETNTLRIDTVDYFTDEPLTPKTEQGENQLIEFPSGILKLGASIVKKGFRYSAYFDNTTLATLLEEYQQGTTVEVGASGGPYDAVLERREITENPVNETQTKVELFCVTSVARTYFNLNPVGTHTLSIARTGEVGSPYTYTTDFPTKQIDEAPEIETNDDNEGVQDPVYTITKKTTLITFYVDRATAFAIKENFELGGVMTIDGTPILESRPVTPEELAPDLYLVEVQALTEATPFFIASIL